MSETQSPVPLVVGMLAIAALFALGMLADMHHKPAAPGLHCGPANMDAVQIIEIPNAAAIMRPLIQEG